MRRLAVVVGGVVVALALAGAANAQSFTLGETDVRVDVGADGGIVVQEDITVSFSGAFTFGYRDIPLREGETIDGIAVLDGGRAYRPGAPTALEPGGPP